MVSPGSTFGQDIAFGMLTELESVCVRIGCAVGSDERRPFDHVVDAGNRLATSPVGHDASQSLGSLVIGQENPARRVGQNYSLLGCHATMIFEMRGAPGSPET